VLTQELVYSSSVLGQIVVPPGFITDMASTPSALWSDLPPWGKYGPAAVVHDFLYASGIGTREQADNVLREAMQDLGVDWRRAELIFDGVRIGGQHAWDQDARERAAGKPHVST
jgi:Protein of unknown function (DUF1353)